MDADTPRRGPRVLLVSTYYRPEETGNAPYVAGLAEHLAADGRAVTVLTGMPHYPRWRVFPGYRGRLAYREQMGGVDVRRRWHYVPGRQSAARRGLYEATFALTGLSALALPRSDAVIGVVPTLADGVLAHLAARRFGAPYGLVFQDLVGPAAAQSGVRGGGRVAEAVRRVEGWVARGAARIGIIAEGFRPYLESLGVAPEAIGRLRNWTHVEPPTLGRTAAREQLGLPLDAAVALHAGNMGHKQGLEHVVECARLAAEREPGLLVVLMGDGNQRPGLEALVARHRLHNVRFLPLQPRERFPNALAAADVLLVHQRRSVADMSLPGKLTAYFAAGRPVVAAVAPDSETAREVAAAGAGVVVPAEEPEALLHGIRRLLASPERCEELGAAGTRYAAGCLSAAAVLREYDAFVADVMRSTRRPITGMEAG